MSYPFFLPENDKTCTYPYIPESSKKCIKQCCEWYETIPQKNVIYLTVGSISALMSLLFIILLFKVYKIVKKNSQNQLKSTDKYTLIMISSLIFNNGFLSAVYYTTAYFILTKNCRNYCAHLTLITYFDEIQVFFLCMAIVINLRIWLNFYVKIEKTAIN